MIYRLLKKRLSGALSADSKRKVICLFGLRQVGKTTLMRDGQEIDLIEESLDGTDLSAFEFKWGADRRNVRIPKLFTETYPHAQTDVITPDNIHDFLLSARQISTVR